ncbi:MAG: hypothetical protein WBF97_03545, partial [Comamonas sp.]
MRALAEAARHVLDLWRQQLDGASQRRLRQRQEQDGVRDEKHQQALVERGHEAQREEHQRQRHHHARQAVHDVRQALGCLGPSAAL